MREIKEWPFPVDCYSKAESLFSLFVVRSSRHFVYDVNRHGMGGAWNIVDVCYDISFPDSAQVRSVSFVQANDVDARSLTHILAQSYTNV